MYDTSDTFVAVSTPKGSSVKSIIRISGPEVFWVLNKIFQPMIKKPQRGIYTGSLSIAARLEVNAKVYLFPARHSYNGDDLAEIHICTSPVVVESIISFLLSRDVRPAEPGEFTARAYLNGKMDLSQAEAVAEVVTSSNKIQLAAAEKLLAGRLAEAVSEIREKLLDIVSMIEAGMDFSGEDIEFITQQQAVERISGICEKLEELLQGSIRYEALVDMAAVGIGGAANAGKSSLLNALLGQQRSIVSSRLATTRDVLTDLCQLKDCSCVMFDCAGLRPVVNSQAGILDELCRAAAIEALNAAEVVIFCVDISKDDFSEDIEILKLLDVNKMIAVATKCDLVDSKSIDQKLAELKRLFGVEFIATSAKTHKGIEQLKDFINGTITELKITARESADQIALTERHKLAVEQTAGNLTEAVSELKAGNDEVASMLLRAGYQILSNLQQHGIDEAVLERIFSHFCIGK